MLTEPPGGVIARRSTRAQRRPGGRTTITGRRLPGETE